MKRIILILSVLTSMAFAENPDGKGYIEPHFIIGGGVGNSKSILLNSPLNWELNNMDGGFSLIFVRPLGEQTSLIIKPYYSYWQVRNISKSLSQNLHQFGADIGIRFYLK